MKEIKKLEADIQEYIRVKMFKDNADNKADEILEFMLRLSEVVKKVVNKIENKK